MSPVIIAVVIFLVIVAAANLKMRLDTVKKTLKTGKSPFDAGVLDPSVYDHPNGISTEGGTFNDRTNG